MSGISRSIDWKKNEGLVPAIVQDAVSGDILMLAYMSSESLAKTLETGHVTFFSRSRKSLWTKGETSGNLLSFVSLDVDCDGDAILVQARPSGPVCHLGTPTCFGETPSPHGRGTDLFFLNQLSSVIEGRFATPNPSGSYVGRLAAAGLDRIAQKVGEEAVETVIASKNPELEKFENEAADLLFHLMVLLKARGSSLASVTKVLSGRHPVANQQRS